MKNFIKAFITAGLLLVATSAQAATYYVSKAGSDAHACSTTDDAAHDKLTINGGISCLSAGDTLLVHTGNYNESVSSVTSGTSWVNKTRIAAYPGTGTVETVWLKPLDNAHSIGGRIVLLDGAYHYIEFDGINMDGTALTGAECLFWASTNNGNNPHHIRLQNAEVIADQLGGSAATCFGGHTTIGATGSNEIINMTIHGGGLPGGCGFSCSSYGIYLAGPNNLVDGDDIYDTSGAGIQIYNAGGDPPDGNTIRNTKIHDITRTGDVNEVWGIIDVGNSTQIYNNVIFNITVGAVNAGNAGIASTQTGNKIWNNTIYNVSNSGIFLDGGAVSTEVRNNIVYLSGGSAFADGGVGTIKDHNLLGTNPNFVNPSTGDFHILAGPAVNTGATIPTVTTDFDGLVRPQGANYCIGAFEFPVGGGVGSGPYWVSKSGNDANACNSSVTPLTSTAKLTITAGLACLNAPGQVLNVRAGTYAENINMHDAPSGTDLSTNAITILGYASETVTIQPAAGNVALYIDPDTEVAFQIWQNLIVDCTNLTDSTAGCVYLGNSVHDFLFQNNTIKNSYWAGLIIHQGPHINIVNNIIHDGNTSATASGAGIRMESYTGDVAGADQQNNIQGNTIYNYTGTATDACMRLIADGTNTNSFGGTIIQQNLMHNCALGAVLDGALTVPVLFKNNIIYSSSTGSCIGLDKRLAGTQIYNNTFYGCAGVGVQIGNGGAVTNAQVFNNAIDNAVGAPVDVYNTSGTSYCICKFNNINGNGNGNAVIDANSLSTFASNITSAPLFTNAGAHDFSLQTGSPLRDAGTSLVLVFNDFIGTARPQNGSWDISAYEFIGAPISSSGIFGFTFP